MNAPRKQLEEHLLTGPFVVAAVLCDGFDSTSGSILGARLGIPATPAVSRTVCVLVAAGAWRRPFRLRVEYRGPETEASRLLWEVRMQFEHIGSFQFIPVPLVPDAVQGLHWICVSIGGRPVLRSPFLALAAAPPVPFRQRNDAPSRR